MKVGSYYRKGKKYAVVADNGVEYRVKDRHNAMLLSRMLRTTKGSRAEYDLDYQREVADVEVAHV